MNPLLLSLICGIGFGALAVALMLPMSFPDKPTALMAAFASRFAIGAIGVVGGAIIGFIANRVTG